MHLLISRKVKICVHALGLLVSLLVAYEHFAPITGEYLEARSNRAKIAEFQVEGSDEFYSVYRQAHKLIRSKYNCFNPDLKEIAAILAREKPWATAEFVQDQISRLYEDVRWAYDYDYGERYDDRSWDAQMLWNDQSDLWITIIGRFVAGLGISSVIAMFLPYFLAVSLCLLVCHGRIILNPFPEASVYQSVIADQQNEPGGADLADEDSALTESMQYRPVFKQIGVILNLLMTTWPLCNRTTALSRAPPQISGGA